MNRCEIIDVTIINPEKKFLGFFLINQAKNNMKITDDLKNELLQKPKTIESITVLYKKKKKYEGKLALVSESPFEVKIFDKDNKNKVEMEHFIDFEKAIEISVAHFDGTISVFKDVEVD